MQSLDQRLAAWAPWVGDGKAEIEAAMLRLAEDLERDSVTLSGDDIAALVRIAWPRRRPQSVGSVQFVGTPLAALSPARPRLTATALDELNRSIASHLRVSGVSVDAGMIAAYAGTIQSVELRQVVTWQRSLDVHAIAMLPVERMAQLSPDALPDTGVADSALFEWLHGLCFQSLPQDWAEEAARRRYVRQQNARSRSDDVAQLVSESALSRDFLERLAAMCGERALTPEQVAEVWGASLRGSDDHEARRRLRVAGFDQARPFTFEEVQGLPDFPRVAGHLVGWLTRRQIEVDARTLRLADGFALGFCEQLADLEDVDDVPFALLSAHFAGINWADEHMGEVDLLLELAFVGWTTDQTRKRGALLDYLHLLGIASR